jgi:hypothetical protein
MAKGTKAMLSQWECELSIGLRRSIVTITLYKYVVLNSQKKSTLFFFKLDNVELKDGLIPCAVLGRKTEAACFSARTGCKI